MAHGFRGISLWSACSKTETSWGRAWLSRVRRKDAEKKGPETLEHFSWLKILCFSFNVVNVVYTQSDVCISVKYKF